MSCSVEGCLKPAHTKGFCKNHYMRQYLYGRLHKINTGDKRDHPFYNLWFERKQTNYLCTEWLDFWIFVKDISPKPEGNYLLMRLDGAKPYGPDNFKWQEHLKRKPGETRKAFWARKWASRQAAFPTMERERNFKRSYGITLDQYKEMQIAQNNVCAICRNAETSVSGRTQGPKNLCVDHCHTTNKVRELLCWRCNSVIGRVGESLELLQAMINYLLKHKEAELG